MFAGTTKLSQTSILRKSPAKAGLLVSMWSTCGRDLKQILLFHYVVNFKKAPAGAFFILFDNASPFSCIVQLNGEDRTCTAKPR
jgi:hypothetical protein